MEDGRWQVTIGNQVMVVDGEAHVSELVPTIIDEPKPRRNDAHPTMKPVALIERMLKHSARPKDIVLDPFGGSGSTMIAAERLGMVARLAELDPRYCDVIVARYEQFTGRKAELENHD
jgi:DNA modification methylase